MTTRVAADIDDRKVFRRLPAVETIYAIKYRKWNFFFVLYYVLFPVNKYVCMYVCNIVTPLFTQSSIRSDAMDFKIQYQFLSETLSCDYRVGCQIHPQNPPGW